MAVWQWHRRQVVLGGLLTLVPGPFACAAPAQTAQTAQNPDQGGCWLPEEQTSSFTHSHNNGRALAREVLVSQSGVEDLELALVLTLQHLADMFGVLPNFSYYEEKGGRNAKATSRDLLGGRQDGTVLLGTRLLRDLLARPYRDAAIVAVCAHEFGHIISYANGMIHKLAAKTDASPFRAEQFADFMAGYYAGVRKREDADFPAVMFADSVSRFGDSTHGSGTERAEAVVEGFKRAWYAQDQPLAAAQRGLAFALSRTQG